MPADNILGSTWILLGGIFPEKQGTASLAETKPRGPGLALRTGQVRRLPLASIKAV
jgi:hypothetical protein